MVSIQRCCRFGVYLFYDPADGTVDSQPVPTLVFSSIPLRVCVCVCEREREREREEETRIKQEGGDGDT